MVFPKFLIVLLALVNYGVCQSKHLQFVKPPPGEDVILHIMSHSNLQNTVVYGSSTEENVILIESKMGEYRIKFNCEVNKMHKDFPVQFGKFCNVLPTGDDCFKVKSTGHQAKTIFKHGLEIKAVTRKTTGLTVDATLKEGSTDKTGKYYCLIESSTESIKSNYFDVVDQLFMETNKLKPTQSQLKTYNTDRNLTNSDLPLKLECGSNQLSYVDEKYRFYLKSPVRWLLCRLKNIEHKSTEACRGQFFADRGKHMFTDQMGSTEILPDNSIVFTSFSRGLTQSVAPMCMFSGEIVAIHWGKNDGDGFPFSSTGTNTKFIAISPLKQTVMLRRGKLFTSKKSIDLLYSSPQKNATRWTFTKKGTAQEFDTLPNSVTGDKDQLKLPSIVTDDIAGDYILNVGSDKFTITLTVYGPPTLTTNLPEYEFVMVGGSVSFKANYEQPGTQKKIEINGKEIKKEGSKWTTNELPSVLRGLKFDVKPYPFKLDGPVTYTANNLQTGSLTGQTESHIVTFIGFNDYGRISSSVRVRVLKKPSPSISPISCTENCMNYDQHVFNCQVEESNYKLQGAVVFYYWTINGVDVKLTALKSYVEVLPNNTLVLNKIFREDENGPKALDLLKNGTLTCRVRLFHPDISQQADHYRITSDKYLVFDTTSDGEINRALSANVILQQNGSVSPINASFFWIAGGIVIALISHM